jgi:hypothetical protein
VVALGGGSELLICQYRVLGTYVGRKLTATRAITFGEDNHCFALTKGRYHSNDNLNVYGSKYRGNAASRRGRIVAAEMRPAARGHASLIREYVISHFYIPAL